MHFRTTNFVHTNSKTLIVILPFFLLLLPCTFISECGSASYSVFYKDCLQLHHQLDLCRLMQSVHCCSTKFYNELERPTQETLMGFAGPHNVKNLCLLNIHSVFFTCFQSYFSWLGVVYVLQFLVFKEK
jgi:hypothetical protein